MYALTTAPEQLTGAATRTVKAQTVQIQSAQPCTGNSYGTGPIEFPFLVAGGVWWYPPGCYIRARIKILNEQTGRPITDVDAVAPAQDIMNATLTQCEFQIRGVTVSRFQEYVAQGSQALRRSNTSWAHQVTTGESKMMADEPSWDLRQRAVAQPCYPKYNTTFVEYNSSDITADLTTRVANPPRVTVAAAGAGFTDLTFTNCIPFPVQIGDEIFYFAPGPVLVHGTVVDAVAATCRIDGGNPGPIAITTIVGDNFIIRRSVRTSVPVWRGGAFEIVFLPPLSIFQVQHALPSMSCNLKLTPRSGNQYAIAALNTKPASLFDPPAAAAVAVAANAPPIGGAGFRVIIEDLKFYCQQMTADRIDEGRFYIDISTLQVSGQAVDSVSGMQTKTFPVSPSTYELSVAFQDASAGQSTQYPLAEFTYWRQPVPAADPMFYASHNDLRRLHIQYSNVTYPQPDAEPFVEVSLQGPAGNANVKAWAVQRWYETSLSSGAAQGIGGFETIDMWMSRGPMYTFATYRDPADRSTNVNVSYTLAQAATNVQVLLFSKSRQVISCTVTNGLVSEVEIQDQ